MLFAKYSSIFNACCIVSGEYFPYIALLNFVINASKFNDSEVGFGVVGAGTEVVVGVVTDVGTVLGVTGAGVTGTAVGVGAGVTATGVGSNAVLYCLVPKAPRIP